jgi:hypothetical protein
VVTLLISGSAAGLSEDVVSDFGEQDTRLSSTLLHVRLVLTQGYEPPKMETGTYGVLADTPGVANPAPWLFFAAAFFLSFLEGILTAVGVCAD